MVIGVDLAVSRDKVVEVGARWAISGCAAIMAFKSSRLAPDMLTVGGIGARMRAPFLDAGLWVAPIAIKGMDVWVIAWIAA